VDARVPAGLHARRDRARSFHRLREERLHRPPDVWADEPIWKDGEVVGFVTSGGYAHFVEKSVALGFVPSAMIEAGAGFEIEILGDLRPATLITEALFDPRGERMRG
jgi:dimethylglycine dehydrogenase